MKEFSLKKSMLMLVALFTLGACGSTSDGSSSGINAWGRKVGGWTLTKTSDESLIGTFSTDASTFTLAAGVITDFSQFSSYTEYNTESVFYIIEESATSTTASYLSKDKTPTFQLNFEIDGNYVNITYKLIDNSSQINNDTQKTYFHTEGSFSK